MNNDAIKLYITDECGTYHNKAPCPKCGGTLKPIGLGKKNKGKIQLIRICKKCTIRFWYWMGIKGALVALSDI